MFRRVLPEVRNLRKLYTSKEGVGLRNLKNQGVGFERKFNSNGVEWEEDQYPKTKFVPQQVKYDPVGERSNFKKNPTHTQDQW